MHNTIDGLKIGILKDVNTIYSSSTNDTKPVMQCYCIGADKCSNTSCRLVQEYMTLKFK